MDFQTYNNNEDEVTRSAARRAAAIRDRVRPGLPVVTVAKLAAAAVVLAYVIGKVI